MRTKRNDASIKLALARLALEQNNDDKALERLDEARGLIVSLAMERLPNGR